MELDEIKKHYLKVYKEAPVATAPKSASAKKRKIDTIEIDVDADEAGPSKKPKTKKALAKEIRDLVEQQQKLMFTMMSIAAELEM